MGRKSDGAYLVHNLKRVTEDKGEMHLISYWNDCAIERFTGMMGKHLTGSNKNRVAWYDLNATNLEKKLNDALQSDPPDYVRVAMYAMLTHYKKQAEAEE
jgi:hypothetical protein